ncbi:proline iminopeptidase [Rhizobium mongolense]
MKAVRTGDPSCLRFIPKSNPMTQVSWRPETVTGSTGNAAATPSARLRSFSTAVPGSGCSAAARRYFDPSAYRIVLFDQRNCGRSLPSAAEFDTDLAANTTWHLVDDIERLRLHLDVETWVIFANSWGSTLALAYAESHPDRARALAIAGVTTTRHAEIDWLCRSMARFFPEEWRRLREAIPPNLRHLDTLSAFYQLLNAPDQEVRLKAARDWHDWESAPILLADPDGLPHRWRDPDYLLARARIVTHYFHNGAWLEDGVLLRNAGRLSGIPGILVQGRFDLEAPLTTAWELAEAWPGSRLVVVENAAHSTSNMAISSAIVAATDEFREISQK